MKNHVIRDFVVQTDYILIFLKWEFLLNDEAVNYILIKNQNKINLMNYNVNIT